MPVGTYEITGKRITFIMEQDGLHIEFYENKQVMVFISNIQICPFGNANVAFKSENL